MASYLHPGVYVEEVPGARPIEGVPTNIAAFIGYTMAGPVNKPVRITSWKEYMEKFGTLTWNRFTSWAVYTFLREGGATAYIVNAVNNGAKGAAATGDINFTATTAGAWANDFAIGIVNKDDVSFDVQILGAKSGDPTSLNQMLVNAYIKSNKSPASVLNADLFVLESYEGFTATDLISQTLADGTVVQSGIEQRINGVSLFVTVTLGDAPVIPQGGVTAMAGGSDDSNPSFTNAIGSLDPVTGFSIMALPDAAYYTQYASGAVSNSETTKGFISELLGQAAEWKRSFMAIDPPYGFDPSGVTGFKTGSGTNVGPPLNSTYGALYYPWVEFRNPITGKFVWLPPSGMMLGRYAATDNTAGVGKAPAGVEDGRLLSASGVAFDVSPVQQDELNPNGIDAIRRIMNYGICIYGARTVSLDPEWKYVNVRRLAIFIENSLYNALQWAVFEPNGPNTWARVVRDVSAFMTGLWTAGQLFGNAAAEAFFVVCDSSNNPPDQRDLGRMFIDVGFAPLKPAEFVIISLSQMVQAA